MNAVHGILLSLLVIYAHQSIADTQSKRIEVGDKMVSIPAPAGFHEISELSPKVREFAESVTPPHHRLLAVFVSDDDFQRIAKGESPEMRKYMLLQVNRKLEHRSVSDTQFSQLVGQVKQEHHNLREKTKDTTDSWLSDASGKLSKEYGAIVDLAVGEPMPLGVFLEQNGAIGFAQLVKSRISIGGEQIDYLVIGGASLMKVRGKVLEAYVNSKYEAQNDVEWVRATSRTWIDQILATNLPQEPAAQTPTQSVSITRSDWNSMIGEAIKGGTGVIVLGLLVGLVSLVVIALKKLFWKKKP